jgi:hypothetical protein
MCKAVNGRCPFNHRQVLLLTAVAGPLGSILRVIHIGIDFGKTGISPKRRKTSPLRVIVIPWRTILTRPHKSYSHLKEPPENSLKIRSTPLKRVKFFTPLAALDPIAVKNLPKLSPQAWSRHARMCDYLSRWNLLND